MHFCRTHLWGFDQYLLLMFLHLSFKSDAVLPSANSNVLRMCRQSKPYSLTPFCRALSSSQVNGFCWRRGVCLIWPSISCFWKDLDIYNFFKTRFIIGKTGCDHVTSMLRFLKMSCIYDWLASEKGVHPFRNLLSRVLTSVQLLPRHAYTHFYCILVYARDRRSTMQTQWKRHSIDAPPVTNSNHTLDRNLTLWPWSRDFDLIFWQ